MSTQFLSRQMLAFVSMMLIAAFALVSSVSSSQAKRKKLKEVAIANQGTVGLISGGFGSTNLRIVADLATVLNKKHKLRLLPMIGQGSVQNIDDILYLKGIDVGIVQSDVFEVFKKGWYPPGYR